MPTISSRFTLQSFLRFTPMVTVRCANQTYDDIQAILFDKDGTLADTAPYLQALGRHRAEAVAKRIQPQPSRKAIETQLLKAFGFEQGQLNPSGMLAVASRVQTEAAAAAFVAAQGKDWHQAMAIAQGAFEEADQQMPRKAEMTHLFPAAGPILQKLHQAGIKLGIISADITANIDDFVEYHALAPIIDVSWGNDRPPSKPDPQAYHQACQQLGVPPEKTLMLGDAEGDMSMAKGAQAAGCIGVSWGWYQPKNAGDAPNFELPSADVILTQWDDFSLF